MSNVKLDYKNSGITDKEIMKFFPNILTKDETINFYNKINDELNTYGYGLYAC